MKDTTPDKKPEVGPLDDVIALVKEIENIPEILARAKKHIMTNSTRNSESNKPAINAEDQRGNTSEADPSLAEEYRQIAKDFESALQRVEAERDALRSMNERLQAESAAKSVELEATRAAKSADQAKLSRLQKALEESETRNRRFSDTVHLASLKPKSRVGLDGTTAVSSTARLPVGPRVGGTTLHKKTLNDTPRDPIISHPPRQFPKVLPKMTMACRAERVSFDVALAKAFKPALGPSPETPPTRGRRVSEAFPMGNEEPKAKKPRIGEKSGRSGHDA